MDEFELISRYFDRRRNVAGVVEGIGDDGAVLVPGSNKQQVQVIDTLVEGVHFPDTADPADIAYRAVAVNLSDIAAMGANPRWMTLALTIDKADERWLKSFSDGLFSAADEHDLALVGGDTTRGPATIVTVAISGEVDEGKALLRRGAKHGDGIYVTGTLGDAAAGLRLLQRGAKDEFLLRRFLRPTARVLTGRALVGRASAAIDLSDGLLGDISKLLAASQVGAEIDIDRLPLSPAVRENFDADEQVRLAMTGGDDYELCFTADEDSVSEIPDVTRIGAITESAGLICRRQGEIVELNDSGYRHFR